MFLVGSLEVERERLGVSLFTRDKQQIACDSRKSVTGPLQNNTRKSGAANRYGILET